MKHFFWIFVAIYASVMMVACNKNSGGDPGIIGGVCVTQTAAGCVDANGVLVAGGYYGGATQLASVTTGRNNARSASSIKLLTENFCERPWAFATNTQTAAAQLAAALG
jgi:hypothetical protein